MNVNNKNFIIEKNVVHLNNIDVDLNIQNISENILLNSFNLNCQILGIFSYGSRNYNIHNETSDFDFVILLKSNEELHLQYESKDLDLHFLSENVYLKLLEEHHIMALECFYNKTPIINYVCDFNLNKQVLRHSISQIVNNSWAKAKKKIDLENEDSYIGLKSLNHSFRILDFGIQLAEFNDIINFDYSEKNLLNMYDLNSFNSFNDLKVVFKDKHNKMMTEFRKLATK